MGWFRGGQDPSTPYGGLFNPERRRKRREARQAGGREGVGKWRQERWLERRGLGEVGWDESGYAEPLEEEYDLLEKDLERMMAERAGGYGVQAAMTGGRESSTFQQQLGTLGAQQLQALAQGRSGIEAQKAAWGEAEQMRTRGELAARGARRAQIFGSFLPGKMGERVAAFGTGGLTQEAQSYEDEYAELMRMLREREGDLSELRDIYGESQWGGY